MKLCIVRDNTIAEVSMVENQPSLEDINNEFLFFENYRYKLIVRDSIGYESMELFVGDYSIPLHYNEETDCYETDTYLVFEGCFDLVSISVYVNDENDEEKTFFTEFLRIATTKQTVKKIEQMLHEIEENFPGFLDVCFSKNNKHSGIRKSNVKSIWNTLKIIDEIIKIYEENSASFSNHKKTSVKPMESIVDVHSMRTINQESLRWIACNPDNLFLTEKDSGIRVNDKNYMPLKVKTYISQYSYDVYENRVVLGFIKSIIEYLENQINAFNKEIMELEKIPNTIVEKLPNTHELTGRCVYIYYKGIVEQFSDRKDILQAIFYNYKKILDCLPLEIYDCPKLTNTFKQVYHYRICYECMVKWYETGDYTLHNLNYLFKLKTLSRIFEYFCLIKIQKAIALCGYVLQKTDRIVYDEERELENINNQYVFYGNGQEITLLYEPFIWGDKINDGVNLYSTGYNFLKAKWNDIPWKPDFVIKISSDYGEYYYILDAKYSNFWNVKQRYISNLVLKYGTQIASKDKFFSEVIGVGAIYPAEKDKLYFFKRNAINSSKRSLPIYFSLTILGDNIGDFSLKERLKDLLKIVESIELEKEGTNMNLISNNYENFQNDTMVQQETNIEITSLTEKTDDNYEEKQNLSEKVVTEKQEKTIIVNGKNCFYYGKNLCLYKRNKKTSCDVKEKACECYISKKYEKLFKKEKTCRNFKYTKVKAECSVSGLNGCVGPENCKFYMKKNKSKK